jgi:hypothetical protein
MALKAVLINVFGGEISAGEFGKDGMRFKITRKL